MLKYYNSFSMKNNCLGATFKIASFVVCKRVRCTNVMYASCHDRTRVKIQLPPESSLCFLLASGFSQNNHHLKLHFHLLLYFVFVYFIDRTSFCSTLCSITYVQFWVMYPCCGKSIFFFFF